MAKLVSVVIPNWNGRELLRVCLSSLNKQTFKDFETIVVDNGSTDGSVGYLKRYFPKVRIIKLDKNYGFSPAVNQGIKAASGRYIVLLNNDTKIDKDCLKYLVAAANKGKQIGMVAAKMLNFYQPELIDSSGDYIDAVGHAGNIGMGEKDTTKFNISKPVFLVCGGGCLIKKEVFSRVGLLDEEYFAYFEDVDLCLRAQLAGFKGWYEPKAIIYHVHKATSSKNTHLTEYLQFRNMTVTMIKNFPKEVFLSNLNWLKIILVNINTIRFLAAKGFLLEALKADWYVLRNIIKILRKRRTIQESIRVNKQYIINNIRPKQISFFGLFSPGL